MLNKSALINSLTSFIDKESVDFTSFPKSTEDAAELFGRALVNYTSNIIPQSISHELAKQQFVTIFKEMNYTSANGNIILVNALNQFVLQLGIGMIGLNSIVTSTPPIFTNEDFVSVWSLGFNGGSSEECINTFCNIIDLKMILGFSTTIVGIVIKWT